LKKDHGMSQREINDLLKKHNINKEDLTTWN
jgi:hypothetical protein